MAVCGVVPVAAMVPVFPSMVHMPALQRDHYCMLVLAWGLDWQVERSFFFVFMVCLSCRDGDGDGGVLTVRSDTCGSMTACATPNG